MDRLVDTIPPGASGIESAAVFKVGVHAGLFGGYTTRWVILEQGIEEVQTILFEVRNECPRFITFPFGESRFEVGEGSDAGPGTFIRSTEEPVGQER